MTNLWFNIQAFKNASLGSSSEDPVRISCSRLGELIRHYNAGGNDPDSGDLVPLEHSNASP